ncbi:transposase [Streptomyces sp. NBC_01750]|uniref:transposase n=1 Tax=Streptomyces sp. NBC_01750 TaxID=2975928 RepID=UPI002DD9C4B6|nr:transposase [Streptomyces sp. NBC_01750]WSD37572.1 transposase [Streptomyces sp. NBC_01750]
MRRALAGMPLPRAANGRILLAADDSAWLRPVANACPHRAFCHTFGRGEGKCQMGSAGRTRSWPRWRPADVVDGSAGWVRNPSRTSPR